MSFRNFKNQFVIKTKTYHIERIRSTGPVVLKERKKILDFGITLGSYNSFVDQVIALAKARASAVVCVANVHMFVEAYRDKQFLRTLNEADIVTPDGRPLVWSLQLLYGIRQDRVCGMDILPDLLKQLMIQQLPVYFLGGSEDMLWRTELYCKENYPTLPLAGYYSPPYRSLSEDEKNDLIKDLNRSGAAIVFFVLGCPKQEKLMSSLKGKVHATMIGIGGALPVMIGEKKRAPKWMQLYGFEWLFRFGQEPKRLFKRYTSTNFFFLYLMIKEVVKVRVIKRKVGLYQ